ncbi:TadE/TadG family type IV pilus assembly protein [Acetobacter vaccinii]|uniref:Pilus assembly protein n=1 Tax=Acetobacter vaccinii TaxID=2592655 RepID=A0A5C1YQ02_9PROT|nr:TadE/TadG family type IV pilus assembly protein [Acetobacter vaccinii]QEO17618.1 pilus assembly protein [Acetobacter vaccinii]
MSFCKDRKGVVAILLAITLPALLLIMAIGIDLSRVYVVKQRLQTAVDAATTAVGLEGSLDDPTAGAADADKLFWTNFTPSSGQSGSGVLDSTSTGITIGGVDEQRKRVPVSASAIVPLVFGSLLHRDSITVGATGYATFAGTTTQSSLWTGLFKDQNSNCQYNSYLNTLTVAAAAGQALTMSGPVQNNCGTSEWQKTDTVASSNSNTVTSLAFSGTLVLNGTPGAQLCYTSYYLCANNLITIDGNVTINIPIHVQSGVSIATGSVISSSNPSQILDSIGGQITGSTGSVTFSSITYNGENSPFKIGSNVLNVENGATVKGAFTTSAGSQINITGGSVFSVYNAGSTLDSVAITVDASTWTNTDSCTWCKISNATITLRNKATMVTGTESNATATLDTQSSLAFLSGAQVIGTYTLRGGSSINISTLASYNTNLAITLYDTSTIKTASTVISGPGVSNQSYVFTCTTASTCTRH